jgi:hypothetical protein
VFFALVWIESTLYTHVLFWNGSSGPPPPRGWGGGVVSFVRWFMCFVRWFICLSVGVCILAVDLYYGISIGECHSPESQPVRFMPRALLIIVVIAPRTLCVFLLYKVESR